jgi:ribose/xylose/arabinose/galactoside ABC-type transport system permease subunit
LVKRLRALLLHALLVVAGGALILAVQWHWRDVTATLAGLLLVAAGLGAARPGAAVYSGIATGLVLSLAYLVVTLSGRFQPLYQVAPPSLIDAAILAALVMPAIAAAMIGAWLRRRLVKE